MKEITIITYTPIAGQLASQLMKQLIERDCIVKAYLYEKYQVEGCMPFKEAKYLIKESFQDRKPILIIGAVGIAVRLIAPFVTSKVTDAPVIVMDEKGQYVIPILSGHLGGANEYALFLASLTKGIPVITTATDLHHKFAIDLFAKKNQLYITDMEKAKRISSIVLQGGSWQESYIISPYTNNEISDKLLLVPKQLIIGIGCKKGTTLEQVETAIGEVLKENYLHPKAVFKLCSIDLKKEEGGLLAFCRKYAIAYETFSAEMLMKVSGSFIASDFVRSITGVENVCERSAIAGCKEQGEIIVPKQKKKGITIAVVKVPLPKLIFD